MEPLPISSGQTYRPLAHRNMNVVLLMNNIVTLAPQPRTQARSSRVESDWDFGFALGVMGKAKRKTRLADYDFKMAESNYTKLEEKKKNHLECFSAKGKFTTVHQLVLKDKIPCTHILRYNKKHLPCKER